MAKVALSIPSDVLEQAKREVKKKHAKSLSSFVSEALGEKLRRDELTGILDAMDAEHGRPREGAVVVTSDVNDLHRLDPTLTLVRI